MASSTTASSVVGVQSGRAVADLSSKSDGSVSDARVGLVAYATGTDLRRGQVVAVAGIANNPNVGAPVTNGTVTYDTRYNYQVVGNVRRTDTSIVGDRGTRRVDGSTTLTANFNSGSLRSSTNPDFFVIGQINGQSVSGDAIVSYDIRRIGRPSLSGSVRTSLNGQIGDNGVIATFHGTENDAAVAGGLVGTAN